ncbi:glycosyltransferase family 4 protein [Chitinophaga nivalis]|uniref:Glycosyltransferase family 4 protein n=1 Tax=Chitinophaga nivalis TaxID=2991709 RepID=A0ABT3IMZ7_9BACT|nr:glycosyltransferase family 4 protein [Chitinophaga nivalis]MCW3464961.1 glycosyltransferase family 4 protein [Chitinophaga nivalis]MCW3485347.1 glycosyltransferase family 4 protein [Chitinophaga nivalis]
MKILKEIIWLTPDLSGLGGSEYMVTSFCRLLQRSGIHVHMITSAVHPSWKQVLGLNHAPGQIHLHEVGSFEWRDFAAVVDQITRSTSISLMQVMPLETFCFDIIRFKKYDFPVCGLEPTDLSDQCWWLPENLAQVMQQLDGLLVLNPHAETTARSRHHFLKPIQLIANTVMHDLYTTSDHTYPPTTFGCISRLSAEKGLEYLLGAMRLLSDRQPLLSLGIWGEGEDRERLLNQAKMLGIEEQVHFHGAFHPFKDSLAITASAAVFVLPSLFEGCPVSLLELAGRKKPVISTATSGGKWLLGEDYPGLVPVADTGSLAQRMERAFTDHTFRAQLTGCLQERLDTWFSNAVTSQQLIAFYSNMVAAYHNCIPAE